MLPTPHHQRPADMLAALSAGTTAPASLADTDLLALVVAYQRLRDQITPLPWRYGGERNETTGLDGGHQFRTDVAWFNDEGAPYDENGKYAELAANALPGLLARLHTAEAKLKEQQGRAETLAYYALDSLLYVIPRGLRVSITGAEEAAKKVLLSGGSGLAAEVVAQLGRKEPQGE